MTVKELREKRGEIGGQIEALRKQLPGEERDMTAEETQQWDSLNAAYDAACEAVTAGESRAADAAKREERLAQIADDAKRHGITPGRRNALESGNPDEDLRCAARAWAMDPHGTARQADIDAAQRLGVNLRAQTFNVRLMERPNDTEMRVQSGLSGEAGGYLVQSPIIASQLEVALKSFSGMRQVSETIRTETGADYYWPGYDDTANEGELLPAPSTTATDLDITFGARVWKAYEYSSKAIPVHRSLYQDSNFDIFSIVNAVAGERLGRKQNRDFTVGDGNAKPKGIVTAATLGVTAASTTAITYDELIDLEYSIDPAYRGMGCSYMMNDATVKIVRKLKDGNGNYLWTNANGSTPNMFNGYPVIFNNNMATVAASAKTVIFGLLSKYKIRDVQQMSMQRFVETKGKQNQDEFLAIMRCDGNLLGAGQTVVSYLAQAAS